MEVEENVWKKGVGKDASTKNLGPCHRIKGGIYSKKGESIFTIKRGKRGSTGICGRPVEEVLKRLEENDLFVKPEKCKWKVREVEFLGVVIGPKGVEIQKEKVEGVLNWLVPRNVKEVQKFLGFANYYRRLIKDFARIAALLHVLVRKEQKWK